MFSRSDKFGSTIAMIITYMYYILQRMNKRRREQRDSGGIVICITDKLRSNLSKKVENSIIWLTLKAHRTTGCLDDRLLTMMTDTGFYVP